MRITLSRSIALALIAATALPVAGCAGRGKAKADIPYVARDVGTLYTAARKRLDMGQYKIAAALLDLVEQRGGDQLLPGARLHQFDQIGRAHV